MGELKALRASIASAIEARAHAVARASYKTGTPQWKGAVAHEPDREQPS